MKENPTVFQFDSVIAKFLSLWGDCASGMLPWLTLLNHFLRLWRYMTFETAFLEATLRLCPATTLTDNPPELRSKLQLVPSFVYSSPVVTSRVQKSMKNHRRRRKLSNEIYLCLVDVVCSTVLITCMSLQSFILCTFFHLQIKRKTSWRFLRRLFLYFRWTYRSRFSRENPPTEEDEET